jgi:hypothetical protein
MSSISRPSLASTSPLVSDSISVLSATNLSNSVAVFYQDLQNADYVSLQIQNLPHSSGAGAFSLQGSNDGLSFIALSSMVPSISGMSIALSTAATNLLNLDHPEFRFLEGQYQASHSGTMDLQITVCIRDSSYFHS